MVPVTVAFSKVSTRLRDTLLGGPNGPCTMPPRVLL